MNRTHMITAGIAVVSFAAGGVGGYFLAEKRLRQHYDEVTKRDIEEVKQFYRKLHKEEEFSTPEKAAETLIPEEERAIPVDKPEMAAAIDALKTYSPSKDEEEDKEQKVEIHNVFVDGRQIYGDWNYELEVAKRSEDRPYIITQEEFLEAATDFEQSTLTYYAGDDVLADSLDEPIRNTNELVGDDNLLRFGHGSNDNNIVYIRNHKFEMDFEVLHSRDKFAKAVLGFDEPETRRKTRKFRQGDDE